MKKVFSALLVVFFIVLAFFFFQRQRAVSRLSQLFQAKTYSNYGIRLTLPSAKGTGGGWLRPYVNIPSLVLDLSVWGLEQPVTFQNARASCDLWSCGGVLIEVPQNLSISPEVSVENPSFELRDDLLTTISAGHIRITVKESQNSNEVLVFQGPRLLMGKMAGLFPELLEWGVEGVEFKSARSGAESTWVLGPMALGIKSQGASGEGRDLWTFYGFGEGGEWQDNRKPVRMGAWKYEMLGSVKHFPWSELQAQIHSLSLAAKELKKNYGDSSQDQKAADFDKDLVSFLDQALALLYRVDLLGHSQVFSWKGLSIGKDEVLVSPLEMEASFEEKDGDTVVQSQASLGFFKTKEIGGEKDFHLDLKNFNMVTQATYSGLKPSEVVSLWLRYYRSVLARLGEVANPMLVGKSTDAQSFSPKTSLNDFIKATSVYPNQGSYDFKIGSLDYSGKVEGHHEDLFLKMFVRPQEMGYELGGRFDLQFKEEPKNNVKGGSTQFRWVLILPWNDYLILCRNFLNAPEQKQDWLKPLSGFQGGTDLSFGLDLGSSFFNAQLDLKVRTPLEGLAKVGEIPEDWNSDAALEAWGRGAGEALLQDWARAGSLKFTFKVDRLSKFQAWLDQINPGSSLGLAVLAPYVRLDAQADRLESELKFEQGKILVNGTASPALEKLLAPFLGQVTHSTPVPIP